MAKKDKPVNADALSEFIPKKARTARERKVTISVERAEHDVITEMARVASEKHGQLVSQGSIIRALIHHYNSFE